MIIFTGSDLSLKPQRPNKPKEMKNRRIDMRRGRDFVIKPFGLSSFLLIFDKAAN